MIYLFYTFVLLVASGMLIVLLAAGPDWIRDWRRALRPTTDGSAELTKLREELDRLSAEMARLAEEQSFTTRLLERGDRPSSETGDKNVPV